MPGPDPYYGLDPEFAGNLKSIFRGSTNAAVDHERLSLARAADRAVE